MQHPEQRHLSRLRYIFTVLHKGSINETAAWLAQLAERCSTGQEVAGSNHGRGL